MSDLRPILRTRPAPIRVVYRCGHAGEEYCSPGISEAVREQVCRQAGERACPPCQKAQAAPVPTADEIERDRRLWG